MDKNDLREDIRKLLDEQIKKDAESKSMKICKDLLKLKEIKDADSIGFYLPKPKEVNLEYAIKNLLGKKEISVPITRRTIKFAKLDSLKNIILGKFDVPEPKERTFIDYVPEVIVIPGLAFDKNRNRLGQGLGYYDKYLEKNETKKIGVCFDFQMLKTIPVEQHDVKMDRIITEVKMI